MEQGFGFGAKPRVRPSVYVASIGDYSAGRLVGKWLDATQEPSAMYEEIQAMLAGGSPLFAEEWAIHDFEGFGSIPIDEHTDLETVSRLARGVDQLGEAFAVWITYTSDTSESSAAEFEEAYLGHWKDLREYVEGLAEVVGVAETIVPDGLRDFVTIDVDSLINDLEMDLFVVTASGGGIHVFDRRV